MKKREGKCKKKTKKKKLEACEDTERENGEDREEGNIEKR